MNRPERQFSIVAAGTGDLVFWALAAAIAAAAIYVHAVASFTLPVPWGDEAYFVWQARAFERWNSFVAPELDSSRPILLLPFVYAATLGLVFKVLGYSLELARHLSLVLVLAGFAFLAVLVRRHATPLLALVLVGLFLLNGHFVAMANAARMEAFLFAVVCGALLLMQRGQVWMALAVLSLSPMIHPNGIFFLLPAALYAFLVLGVQRERPSSAVIAVFILSAVVWTANGLYALSYWDGFVHDTALRIGETVKSNEGLSQFGGRQAAGLGLIIATAALGAWRGVAIGHLLVFAIGGWLMSRVRLEQWYAPFNDFAYLLLSLALMELAARTLASSGLLTRAWSRPVAAGTVAASLLVIHVTSGTIQGPRNYLSDMNVAGMRIEGDVAYFSRNDRKAIQDLLKSVEPNRNIVVEVYPWGDGLLIADVDEPRVRIQVPYFGALFYDPERWAWGYGPTEYPTPDLYLIHASQYHPQWLAYRHDQVLARALNLSGAESPLVVSSRDGTEAWYAIRPSGKPR